MSGNFPSFSVADFIRDSVDIAIEEREPKLEELAAELPAGTGSGQFPDPTDLAIDKRWWMSEHLVWMKANLGRYLWRRSIIEVRCHRHCDAQTFDGTAIDALAAGAGITVNTSGFNLLVGTTIDGFDDLTTTFASNGGSGTFWISAVNAVDQGDGTCIINYNFRQVRKWVLATTDAA
jgi:hypothetical protein